MSQESVVWVCVSLTVVPAAPEWCSPVLSSLSGSAAAVLLVQLLVSYSPSPPSSAEIPAALPAPQGTPEHKKFKCTYYSKWHIHLRVPTKEKSCIVLYVCVWVCLTFCALMILNLCSILRHLFLQLSSSVTRGMYGCSTLSSLLLLSTLWPSSSSLR